MFVMIGVLVVCLPLAPSLMAAKIYKTIDINGQIIYSTQAIKDMESKAVDMAPLLDEKEIQRSLKRMSKLIVYARLGDKRRKEEHERKKQCLANIDKLKEKVKEAETALENGRKLKGSDWRRQHIMNSYFERVRKLENNVGEAKKMVENAHWKMSY